MGKFKDLWKAGAASEDQTKRSFLRYAVLATAVFFVCVGFVSKNNLVRWAKAGLEVRRQERRIEDYRKDIERMDGRIHSLTSNKDSLERYARETYHFAAPGDDVYLVGD